MTDRRLDVADVVAEAAVTGDAHDFAIRRRELRPEGCRERPAERAVCPDEVAAGLLRLRQGTSPGRGIPGVRHEDGIVSEAPVEGRHDRLGPHRLAVEPIVGRESGATLVPGGALASELPR